MMGLALRLKSERDRRLRLRHRFGIEFRNFDQAAIIIGCRALFSFYCKTSVAIFPARRNLETSDFLFYALLKRANVVKCFHPSIESILKRKRTKSGHHES